MGDEKWRSTVSQVIPAPIDKVWPILADFDGLHKHFPQIYQLCDNVEGEKNKPGALRYLEAPLPNGFIIKAKERLLAVDDTNYTQKYTLEYINLGWKNYFGYIDAKSAENNQTHVDWSYEVDPVENQTKEQFTPTQDGLFNSVLGILKDALSKSS